MFTAYYALNFNPVTNEIDTKHHFESEDFIQAFARLEILKKHKGIGLLNGEPGSGKSFALRCFVSSLNKSMYKVVYIPITTLTVKEFYRALCDGLGLIPAYKKVDMYKQIQEAIYTYSQKNITPVVIIDEVQFISNSILDDLRLIFNFDMDSKNYSILVLCGQPKLVLQLSRQTHEALTQRIAVNYAFKGLSRNETREYIYSRFKASGRAHPPIDEAAYELIYTTTGGFPRKINSLLTMALLTGLKEQMPILDPDLFLKANAEVGIAL